jgi:hypothetical protein
VLRDAAQVATVAEYVALQLQAKATEDRLKLLNEAIKGMMGGAPVAYAGKHVLSLNEVPAIPPTENRLITAEMVGMVIPGTKGRRGYTQLSVR